MGGIGPSYYHVYSAAARSTRNPSMWLRGGARPNQTKQRVPAHKAVLLPQSKWAGVPALIPRFTGSRAPGLADGLEALPPFPSLRPFTARTLEASDTRTRLHTLGAGVLAAQAGRDGGRRGGGECSHDTSWGAGASGLALLLQRFPQS